MDILRVDNLSYSYGDKKVIDNISFSIKEKSINAILSSNNSCKTTLIKMMTGILKPDKGSIKINGLDIIDDALEAKQNIGYITDSPDMFLRLTGIEFINFISDIYKVNEKTRKEKIKYLAKEFGLEELLDKPMQGYSHGMRQKMMVVAALVHEPSVWILDEPMIGLDPRSAVALKKMMREHVKSGNTVFFSTHVLEVAEKLCDEIVIIDKGKIVYYGTLEALVKKHKKKDLEELFLEVINNE